MKSELQCLVCARTFSVETTNTMSVDEDTAKSITRVSMTSRDVHDNRGGGPKDSRGWFETPDDMEVQVLVMCDGTNNIQYMLAEYIGDDEDDDDEDKNDNDGEEKGKEQKQYQANVFTNIMRRLVRMYDYIFISWG